MNLNKEAVVYVHSTYPIYLGLILKNLGYNIRIITTSNDHQKYYNLANVRCEIFKQYNLSEFIFKFISIRKALHNAKYFIGNEDLFFTHTQFDLFCFILSKFIAKTNDVYLYKIEPDVNDLSDRPVNMQYIKYVVLKEILGLLYGVQLVIKRYGKNYFFGINEKYLAKNNIKLFCLDEKYEVLKNSAIAKNQIELFPIDNLYYSQNEFDSDSFYKDSIIALYEKIKVYDIAIKHHPNMGEHNYFTDKKTVPGYIAGELLFINIKKSVISISSTVLISASWYFEDKNVNVISLLHLVNWKDDFTKQDQEARIKRESKKNVVFPKSFDELNMLLTA